MPRWVFIATLLGRVIEGHFLWDRNDNGERFVAFADFTASSLAACFSSKELTIKLVRFQLIDNVSTQVDHIAMVSRFRSSFLDVPNNGHRDHHLPSFMYYVQESHVKTSLPRLNTGKIAFQIGGWRRKTKVARHETSFGLD